MSESKQLGNKYMYSIKDKWVFCPVVFATDSITCVTELEGM